MPRERQGHPRLSLSEGTAVTGDCEAPQKPALDGKGEVRLQGPRPSTCGQPACCEKFLCTPTVWPFTPRPCVPSGAASAISRRGGSQSCIKKPRRGPQGRPEGRYLLARQTLPLSASLLQANANQEGRWEQEIYLAKHQFDLRSYEKMVAPFSR